jgi:hypothetical protein
MPPVYILMRAVTAVLMARLAHKKTTVHTTNIPRLIIVVTGVGVRPIEFYILALN